MTNYLSYDILYDMKAYDAIVKTVRFENYILPLPLFRNHAIEWVSANIEIDRSKNFNGRRMRIPTIQPRIKGSFNPADLRPINLSDKEGTELVKSLLEQLRITSELCFKRVNETEIDIVKDYKMMKPRWNTMFAIQKTSLEFMAVQAHLIQDDVIIHQIEKLLLMTGGFDDFHNRWVGEMYCYPLGWNVKLVPSPFLPISPTILDPVHTPFWFIIMCLYKFGKAFALFNNINRTFEKLESIKQDKQLLWDILELRALIDSGMDGLRLSVVMDGFQPPGMGRRIRVPKNLKDYFSRNNDLVQFKFKSPFMGSILWHWIGLTFFSKFALQKCQGCPEFFYPERVDQRYCKSDCGTNARMRVRYHRNKKNEK